MSVVNTPTDSALGAWRRKATLRSAFTSGEATTGPFGPPNWAGATPARASAAATAAVKLVLIEFAAFMSVLPSGVGDRGTGPGGRAGRPARSLRDLQHLVRRDTPVRQLPLAVRQDHLHVHLLRLAQPEVGVGRLPRGVAVAGGDLAAAEQRGGFAESALGVDVDARADAHAVDAPGPLDPHP